MTLRRRSFSAPLALAVSALFAGLLLGDPSKAKERLGWEAIITLEQMIREMVDADLARHRARQSR